MNCNYVLTVCPRISKLLTVHNSMGESNTVVSAFALYRHLQQYSSHPSMRLGVLL